MNATTRNQTRTKTLVTLAILAAIAYLVMFVLRIPLMAAVPFLKFDPKDVIIAIGGFIYGPLASVAISVVVSFLEMITVSEAGPIGLVMNILSSCAFVCPAAFIYKKRHGLSGAVIGLITGALAMTAVMLLWNWLITPIYMGLPREAVVAMLLPIFAPFNLIKGGINAAVILLLYKPLVGALRKARLIPPTQSVPAVDPAARRNATIGVVVVAALVLVTCILLVLVLQGSL